MNGSAVARDALVAGLRREVEKLEGGRVVEDERRVSTGVKALDRLLPGGGLKRGTLVEYLSGSTGSGAATLSLAAARKACGEGRAFVVVEKEGEVRGQRSEITSRSSKFKVQSSKLEGRRQKTGDRGQKFGGDGTRSVPATRFYPPAAAAWGIDLAAMLVVRTTNEADALWAFDQALRCPGVGAVWGAWERLDGRDFRRLQLAAEIGGTIGVLIRPARVRGQSTWAEVRLEVGAVPLLGDFARTGFFSRFRKSHYPHPNPLPKGEGTVNSRRRRGGQWPDGWGWRLAVELVRCRGTADGQKVVLELDEMNGEWREVGYEATRAVSVFAELADSTARRA
jgi:protein ImuA